MNPLSPEALTLQGAGVLVWRNASGRGWDCISDLALYWFFFKHFSYNDAEPLAVMELALCTTPIFVVIFCPLLFFMQATLIKKAGLVGGTDYMAVVSCRVFAISFSNLGNVKSWIIQEIEHRKHALQTKMAKMWISLTDFFRDLPFSNYNMRRELWT